MVDPVAPLEDQSQDMIKAHLAKILASETFRNSLRLRQILRYLVEMHLAGDDDALKETLIAIEVFKKTDFDSRLDSSVRRAAGRLRRVLARYYASEGAADDLLIELPEGHYVPRISRRGRGHIRDHSSTISTDGLDLGVTAALEASLHPRTEPLPESAQSDPIRKVLSNGRRWTVLLLLGGVILSVLALVDGKHDQASTKILARRSIAVLDFRNLNNQADTQWLSAAFSESLRSEMAAGAQLRAISDASVNRMMAEINLHGEPNITVETLSKIRRDLGVDLVLTGSYLCTRSESDPKVRVSVEVLETGTGDTLASIIETDGISRLIDLIARIGARVRERLGQQELRLADATRLGSLQPGKIDAIRFYAEGIRKIRRFDAAEAQGLFERAIEIDPNYASARLALADSWSVLGYQAKARDQAKQAFEQSANLPREDALWIEGRYRELSHEWERAIQVYQTLYTFYPDDTDYGLALANCEVSALNPAAAMHTIALMRKTPTEMSKDPRIDLAEAGAAEALGDFIGELSDARRAELEAQQRGARLLAAASQLKQAWALYNLGKYQDATKIALDARRAYASVGDPAGEAAAVKTLADIKSDSGDLDGAWHDYQEALSVFRKLRHSGRVAMTLNNMAYVSKDRGDLEGANRLFIEAANLGREISDRNVQAMALNGKAIILWRLGHIQDAKRTYEEAYEVWTATGNRRQAAVVLNNLAIAFQDLGHLDQAEGYFRRSLEECRAIQDRPGTARELGNLGGLLIKKGHLEEAERDLKEQLSIGREIGDEKEISYALLELGQISMERDDLRTGRQEIEKSLRIRDTLGEKGLAAESQLELAVILCELHDYSFAETVAEQATEEFRREKEADEEIAAMTILSRTLSEVRRFDEAAEAAEEAVKLAEKSQDAEVRFDARVAAAVVRTGLGHVREGRYELEHIAEQAKQLGYAEIAFDARLMSAQAELQQRPLVAVSMLKELEREASEKHFQLIIRKAEMLRSKVGTQGAG